MIKQEPKYHLIKLNTPFLQLFHLKSKAAVQHGEESTRLSEHGVLIPVLCHSSEGPASTNQLLPCQLHHGTLLSTFWISSQESPQEIRPVWEHLGYMTSLPKLLPSPAPQTPRFPKKQHSQSQAFPNAYVPSSIFLFTWVCITTYGLLTYLVHCLYPRLEYNAPGR